MTRPPGQAPFFGIGLFARAFDTSADAVEIEDIEGRIVYVNDAWCQLFEQDRQKVAGAEWDTLQYGDVEVAHLRESWNRCIAGGTSQEVFHVSRASHPTIMVSYTRTLYKNTEGVPSAVLTIYRPLTGMAIAREVSALLAAVLERTESGIAVLDARGTLMSANFHFVLLTGYERDEILGQHLQTLVPHAQGIMTSAIHRYGGWSGKAEINRKDGARMSLSLSMTPVRDDQRATAGFVVRVTTLPATTA